MEDWLWRWYSIFYDVLGKLIPYRQMLDQVARTLPQRGRILDAGCGTGNVVKRIREGGRYWCIGIDFSSAMLARARRKVTEGNFLRCDLNRSVPFGTNSFDGVESVNVLYILRDPFATLTELVRVVKPGGVVTVATLAPNFKPFAIFTAHCRQIRTFKHVMDTLVALFALLIVWGLNAVIMRRAEKGEYHFLKQEELRELFVRGGLQDVEIHQTYAGYGWLATGRKPDIY